MCLIKKDGRKHVATLGPNLRRNLREKGWTVKVLRGFTFVGDMNETSKPEKP